MFDSLGALCFLFFLAMAAPAIIKAISAAAKSRELAELKKNSPEAWVRAKEIELEEKRVEALEQQRKHDRGKMAVGVGLGIARLFLKK